MVNPSVDQWWARRPAAVKGQKPHKDQQGCSGTVRRQNKVKKTEKYLTKI